MDYEFQFYHSSMPPAGLLDEMAKLYSQHYGRWGHSAGDRAGKRVKLSAEKLHDWVKEDSRISVARFDGIVIGYAISIQTNYGAKGLISWVTQLVIHEEHRHRDVAKRLLFSIWGMSDHFAWGLLTANPYAIRALEKATRRRCDPARIKKNAKKLLAIGRKKTTYVTSESEVVINSENSRIDTNFPLDLSELPTMLTNAMHSAPWVMGELPEGWEWFAFTFHDQQEIVLSTNEIEEMIKTSEQVTKQAYSRMQPNSAQNWMKHTPAEVAFIIDECRLAKGDSVLDVGCGTGRHVTGLAKKGIRVTGIDYLPTSSHQSEEETINLQLDARFIKGDARHLELQQLFDAVICLYDVIGSYADQDENVRIIRSCVRHLRPGGRLLLSVMNFEMTERHAKHFFSLESEPRALSDLKPSNIMERSGNVFNPEFYLIDRKTRIVYRKEQFKQGHQLPVELIVRDRRYSREEIKGLCIQEGLVVNWTRYVQSGKWDVELDAVDKDAKEILVLCTRA